MYAILYLLIKIWYNSELLFTVELFVSLIVVLLLFKRKPDILLLFVLKSCNKLYLYIMKKNVYANALYINEHTELKMFNS